jgi:cytochrome b561
MVLVVVVVVCVCVCVGGGGEMMHTACTHFCWHAHISVGVHTFLLACTHFCWRVELRLHPPSLAGQAQGSMAWEV